MDTLIKTPTGIRGLDEITGGGLPSGRATLIAGGPGCGKTLFTTEFLVRGATTYGEPGLLVLFEETADDIVANVASLGFDVRRLVAEGKLHIDQVRVQRHEIEETGDYDLDGLFIRMAYAIDKVGARRVGLDTIEALFSSFSNEGILRAELRRLFGWLKERGVTAVITAERAGQGLTRHGLEEYVSDCVILLDHRVTHQVSTRRLRIVKYRGSAHGTNEYPFLIDETGFAVVPITSAGLDYAASEERVSTGVAGLDDMLGGLGVFRGSTTLISGTAGTGKTSTCAYFADAACRRGERALFLTFEESSAQILRNTRSIGLNLEQHVRGGLLRITAARPTVYGLETHLAKLLRDTEEFRPALVVIDPISALLGGDESVDLQGLVTRMIDKLKESGITSVFSTLTDMVSPTALERTSIGISSLVDTWIMLRDMEATGERNRCIYVLKSRGMSHSNQIREFRITENGVELIPAYLGAHGVLTASARLSHEAKEREEGIRRDLELKRQRVMLARKREAIEGQIASLRADLEAEELALRTLVGEDEARRDRLSHDVLEMATSRRAQDARPDGDGASRAVPADPS